MKKPKILRVIVEYTDKKYIAEGEDAENWVARVNSIEALWFTRFSMSEFHWTRVEEKKDNRESTSKQKRKME